MWYNSSDRRCKQNGDARNRHPATPGKRTLNTIGLTRKAVKEKVSNVKATETELDISFSKDISHVLGQLIELSDQLRELRYKELNYDKKNCEQLNQFIEEQLLDLENESNKSLYDATNEKLELTKKFVDRVRTIDGNISELEIFLLLWQAKEFEAEYQWNLFHE